MSTVDDLVPSYTGEGRIVLSLSRETPNPRAFHIVDVLVDYSRTLPEYVVRPLELIIRAPTDVNFRRRYYTRQVPSIITFQPQEGGTHLVLLRECAHNHWHGKIRIEVDGSRLKPSNI